MRRIVASVALWMAAGAADAFELTDLMATLARAERSPVPFVETRHLAVLTTPVVRRGTLRYERPDRLEMQVVTPFPETVEIAGSRVRVTTGDQRREWDLAGQPVALAWIEAIRASLAGDTATLTRLFRATLDGTPDAWRLALEPRDPRVAATLRRVEVRGRHADLDTIEILEEKGDRVVIAIGGEGRRR